MKNNNYKTKEHFERIAPKGSTLTRLSHNACEYKTQEIVDNGAYTFERGVIYMDTIVIKKIYGRNRSKKYVIDSGGYKTLTTKKWINYLLDCGLELKQKNFKWFIEKGNEKIEFKDGLHFEYYNSVY